VTDEQAKLRGATTREGFAVLGHAIRREPGIFILSTIGSVLFAMLTVADAWVLGWSTDNVVLLGLIDQTGKRFKLVGKPFNREPYGIGIKKGDVKFCEFIDSVLRQAAEDGRYQGWFVPVLSSNPLRFTVCTSLIHSGGNSGRAMERTLLDPGETEFVAELICIGGT